MPILPLKTPGLHYFLISFNARGEEQPEADGEQLMSAQLTSRLARRIHPVTDVFIVCHGWNTTAAAAHDSYVRWMGAMADDSADIRRAAAVRGGGGGGVNEDAFNPLLIGVQWPSKFGDTAGATLPADVLATALDAGAPPPGTGAEAAAATAAAADAATTAAVGAQADALAAALDGDDAARVRADPAAAAALTTLAQSVVVPAAAAGVVAAAAAAASAAKKAGREGGEAAAGGGGGGGGGGGRVAATVAALDAAGPPAPAGGDDAALPAATLDALAAVGAALEPLSEDEDGGATGGTDDGARAATAFRIEAAAAAAESSPLTPPPPPSGDADADAATAAVATAAASGGTLFAPLRLLLRPLSDVVFAAFQRRAAHLGRTAVHRLVASLMDAAGAERARTGAVKFHAIGHRYVPVGVRGRERGAGGGACVACRRGLSFPRQRHCCRGATARLRAERAAMLPSAGKRPSLTIPFAGRPVWRPSLFPPRAPLPPTLACSGLLPARPCATIMCCATQSWRAHGVWRGAWHQAGHLCATGAPPLAGAHPGSSADKGAPPRRRVPASGRAGSPPARRGCRGAHLLPIRPGVG